MRKAIGILAAIIIVMIVLCNFTSAGQLSGSVVVIDPGHGGKDPGASGYFGPNLTRINESPYCYDVALRLEKMIMRKGAKVAKTVVSKNQIFANKPQEVIPWDKEAIFAFDGSIVEARKGLLKRILFANQVLDKNQGRKVIFISIHFDMLTDSNLEGARLIRGKESDKFSSYLEKELVAASRASNSDHPFVKSGDKSHGIKNLYVFGGRNRILEKVLLELGNFRNEKDVWRIRDYRVRENYAQIITRALIKFNSA